MQFYQAAIDGQLGQAWPLLVYLGLILSGVITVVGFQLFTTKPAFVHQCLTNVCRKNIRNTLERFQLPVILLLTTWYKTRHRNHLAVDVFVCVVTDYVLKWYI